MEHDQLEISRQNIKTYIRELRWEYAKIRYNNKFFDDSDETSVSVTIGYISWPTGQDMKFHFVVHYHYEVSTNTIQNLAMCWKTP